MFGEPRIARRQEHLNGQAVDGHRAVPLRRNWDTAVVDGRVTDVVDVVALVGSPIASGELRAPAAVGR